mgnify:CR=1 FL=1
MRQKLKGLLLEVQLSLCAINSLEVQRLPNVGRVLIPRVVQVQHGGSVDGVVEAW